MEQSVEGALDLNEIAVFARVVQAGSFTRAARDLGMPKSTVSRKVSELEQRLDARLLQRTTRKLGLTDAGRTFYRYSARIVAEMEEARRAVLDLQSTPRGLLRVTAPISLGFIGPVVSSFLARHPRVQIDLVCTDRVVDLVEEGFDVGVRAGRLADSSLVARHLGSLRRSLVAAPRYLQRRRAPRSPEDLAKHDCLLFGPTSPRNTWLLEHSSGAREVVVPARLIVNDVDVLREATLAGEGIALLPERSSNEDVRSGRLERVLSEWSAPEVPLSAVYPSTRHLSPKVTAFVNHVVAALKLEAE